jgi:ubiquinone/menaquinone biosynthesis C-methylase UbiE
MSDPRHPHGHGHPGHHHHQDGPTPRDEHGNPVDFEAYLARLDDPERDAWQRPDDVVRALGLAPGMVVCDVGAGAGYFALRVARAVGPAGRVHALDVEPRMLEVLARRAADAGLENVRPHLAERGDALPPEPCDRVLVVNAFHHFTNGVAYLRALGGCLRPGGVIVNVDFRAGELPIGPPDDQRLSREAFLAMAEEAGLRLAGEEGFLPYQYLVHLAPR